MKIIGWMHRKFWQNSSDPLAEIATGPTLNRHQQFVPLVQQNGEGRHWMFQDPPDAAPLLLEGLLAIGTFGSPVIFSLAEEEQTAVVEEIAENETEEATEEDLMVVSAELNKVLAAESEKAKCSGERISLASAGSGGKGAEACPLKGFLFGLPVELGAERRRERRTSLGELLMRSRIEEVLAAGDMGEEITAGGLNAMTKRMRKRRNSVRGNTEETSKFQKILRIFHRKIHPENAASTKKLLKPSKHKEKEMFYMTDNCSKKFNDNGKEMAVVQKEFKREGISRFKCHSYPQSSKGLCRDNLKGKYEHWIKTDADYLVLEL